MSVRQRPTRETAHQQAQPQPSHVDNPRSAGNSNSSASSLADKVPRRRSSRPVRVSVRIAAFLVLVSLLWWASKQIGDPVLGERVLHVAHALFGMAACDVLVACWSKKARWFILHAMGNIAVAVVSLDDLWKTLASPASSLSGEPSYLPAYIVPAIHLYHLVAFDCTLADWVHHIVFGGVICSVGLLLKCGPVQNAVGFFICGLPGGLDYIMLVLVKHGLLDALDEKKWNARINVWIRSPGLMFSAFAILVAQPNSSLNIVVAWVSAFLVAFNGQYYMQQVVGNTVLRSGGHYTS